MTKKSRDRRKLQRLINRTIVIYFNKESERSMNQLMDLIKDGELMIFQSSGGAITQIGK